MEFAIGQRWASHTESQLGLGIITETDGRRIVISFPAVGEERTYAANNAPLSRIKYGVGDQVSNMDEENFTITEVLEHNGLLIYRANDDAGSEHQFPELELNCFVQFTSPVQRLFSGQFDRNDAYTMRIETMAQQERLQNTPVKGLMGSRTSLLPHQIYIAAEVAGRHAPRVLLADEVGLGKTIEAGMILHHQLHTGQAGRVLILVPDSLVHQWLVEMLRRFNLAFSIFDKNRLEAINEDEGNPFETEQQVLCSLSLLTESPEVLALALKAEWDMVVVDEAHHLHWSQEEVSHEYHCVEQLARISEGLLLLTATPEQVGIDSHFARLRLLDPARFHDLEAFKKEEEGYEELNVQVQSLVNGDNELTAQQVKALEPWLGEAASNTNNADKDYWIRQLLDRHGTGRVLFRNTRSAIKGFPKRVLNPEPLPCPEMYEGTRYSLEALFPERDFDPEHWLATDPRVEWLEALLKDLKQQKVLVICHKAETAIALDQYFNLRVGIRSASFFEGLSIVERDRAAAYFSDAEGGAQTLICSEIGSEGRNFQFSSNLVLFDLPLNPDLLEQRIGRLDRIGQKHDIQIHVPYLEGTAQEVLFRWYDQGLNLFTRSCAAGFSIFEHFEDQLLQQLEQPTDELNHLISETKAFTDATLEKMQSGRDPLLELNSCNPVKAASLIEEIQTVEEADALEDYMAGVFDLFGVDHEYLNESSKVIKPTDHMRHAHFPGLKDEGNSITFDRDYALSREDVEFLSWEHPMVYESMDTLLNSELGNATLSTISIKGIPEGTLLMEAWYGINMVSPKELRMERFLSLSPVRFFIDTTGKNLSAAVNYEKLNDIAEPIKKQTAQAIIVQVREEVEKMVSVTDKLALEQLPELQSNAVEKANKFLSEEIQRLQQLQKVNPSIRDEEIDFFKQQLESVEEFIGKASLNMQALRLIINT